jgi:two-component SAPR family response regulator
MLIFAIDDEKAMLTQLHNAIEQAEPGAQIMDFNRAKAALEAISDKGLKPDVVFSDIEMPGMTGLALAIRIKEMSPETKIIFVTAYSEYALEAYKKHVNGYLLKPVEPEMVREELDALDLKPSEKIGGAENNGEKLRVRCFGFFEVYHNGEPVVFARAKAKELLAYLIDREGGICTSGEIISVLWEGVEDERSAKHSLRTVISDLRKELALIGMEEVLIREKRQLGIRREMIDCDYYRMLNGDIDALNSYHGEYMNQYSWAELTSARLQFKQKNEI